MGAAALLHLREEAEIVRTMLAFAEGGAEGDEEARDELFAARELCLAIDEVVAAMPQPKEE